MLTPLNRESGFADEFVDIAMFHVALWEDAFRQQLKRVFAEDEPSEARMVDFVFLVIALHNFRFSLHRCRDELKNVIGRGPGSGYRRQAANWAGRALEIFERDLPQITDIRNVFSHFEEYAYGSGRLQRRSGHPISVVSGGTHTFVVKDADNHFELDLDAALAVMDSVRECWIEVLVWAE